MAGDGAMPCGPRVSCTIPRTFTESMTLPSRPAHYADTLPELLSLATTAERVRHHVSLLWKSTRRWAEELGICLDDDDLAGV